jgi:hypothetical protein
MNRKQFFRAAGHAGACCLLLGPAGLFAAEKTAPQEDEKLAHCNERIEFTKWWVSSFTTLLDQHVDEPTRNTLMQANGAACFMRNAGPEPAAPGSMEKLQLLITRLRATGIYTVEVNGDVLIVSIKPRSQELSCYCRLVEDGPERMSPTFCQCSVGYTQSWFSRVSGRPATAELLESTRTGGNVCRFRVTLG